MKNLFSKDLPEATRRRVDLAVAVAQERLLSTHVDHALNLIEIAGDREPFDNVLAIYTRLLRLSEDEARVISTRALAILGEREATPREWAAPGGLEEEAGADPSGVPRSFIGSIRQRLRGRVNEELRKWVELAAARTEVALMETHVENALHFVDLLERELPFTDAVELYLDALDTRESTAEMVYYLTLARLSEKLLPPFRSHQQDRRQSADDETEGRRLRVVDTEGG